MDVRIRTNKAVNSVGVTNVDVGCTYTGRMTTIETDAIVMVTARVGGDALWQELKARESEWEAAGIRTIKCIGDAESPAPIAWATYAGHRYAREFDGNDIGDNLTFRREVAELIAYEIT